jgi:DNA-binding transcriptional ArsR family regulator
MEDVEVVRDGVVAASMLDPIRGRLLAELGEPASAAALAARMGLPRQKVNYHLRTLEGHGLVSVAEERQWGGLTERLLVASASSYVISPAALGPVAVDPERATDRLSASYLVALAARVVSEVGELWRRARQSGKRLATLSIDTELSFASARERADFSRDLAQAVTGLVARYHSPRAAGARRHRLMVFAHPSPETASRRKD